VGLRDLDLRAVALGAAVVLVVGVPVATIGSLLVDEGSNAAFPLAVLTLLAFVAGGFVAGSKRPDAPLIHGAAAAFVGFAVAQTVSIVLQVVQDDEVSVVAIAFNALLAANIGLFGAWLASRRSVEAER
jgi:hypothetical protein